MAEQIIRDFYGRIIAKIETKPNGEVVEEYIILCYNNCKKYCKKAKCEDIANE